MLEDLPYPNLRLAGGFCLRPQPAIILRPRIEPMPKQWPKTQHWQCQILKSTEPLGNSQDFICLFILAMPTACRSSWARDHNLQWQCWIFNLLQHKKFHPRLTLKLEKSIPYNKVVVAHVQAYRSVGQNWESRNNPLIFTVN